MAALDVVLRYTPSHWKRHTYNNNVYIRVTLKKESEEFKKIEDMIRRLFSNLTVSSIERIQHPFAFGRFCIRKQQLTMVNKYEPTVKHLQLFITDKKKIDLILRHNCDKRRGGFTEKHAIVPNGFILIVKVLDVAYDRDSDRYPEYLITYTYHKIKSKRSVVRSLKHNPTASQQHNPISYESTSTSTPVYDSIEALRSISIQPHNVDLIASNAILRRQSYGASSMKHNPTASQQHNPIPLESTSTSTPVNDSIEALRSIKPHNVDLIVSNAVRRPQNYGVSDSINPLESIKPHQVPLSVPNIFFGRQSYGASSVKHNPTASQQHNPIPFESTSTSTPVNDSIEALRSIQPHNVDLIVSNAVRRPQNYGVSDSINPLESIKPHKVPLSMPNLFCRPQSYGESSLEDILMASQEHNPTHYKITSITPRPVNYSDWSIEDHLRNFQPKCIFKQNVFSRQPARASYQPTLTAGKDDYFQCILQ